MIRTRSDSRAFVGHNPRARGSHDTRNRIESGTTYAQIRAQTRGRLRYTGARPQGRVRGAAPAGAVDVDEPARHHRSPLTAATLIARRHHTKTPVPQERHHPWRLTTTPRARPTTTSPSTRSR